MRALLDACVLYPTVLREILMGCAARGLFTPVWSDRILEEWARATTKLGTEAEAQARGEVALLRARWPEASVAPRAGDLARLHLPDEHDIHVLASAIAASADVLVTLNARDFPQATVRFEGLERVSPDTFLMDLWLASAAPVEAVVCDVHRVACEMSGEDLALRGLMKRAKLPRLGKALG